MRNLTVKYTVHVECTATADQWQLYGNRPGHLTRDLVAVALNTRFCEAVNSGKDIHDIWKAMDEVTEEFKEMGAADSEPYHLIETMLDEVFGKNRAMAP